MINNTQVIHDLFQIKGGGERLIKTLCEGIDADLLTAEVGADTFDLTALNGEVVNLDALSSIHGIKTWSLARAFIKHQPRHRNYENIIYSGVASPLAIKQYPNSNNVFYCHTPPRFVYDKKTFYASQLNPLEKIAFNILLNWFTPKYEQAVAQMDTVLTNSNFVKARIKTALNIDSTVIYPPCDTQHFKWQGSGDYYLSLARHDGLKRIRHIIEAFKQLPDKKLIVASGGAQTAALKQLAAGYENIQFTGWLTEVELLKLIGNCIATIYIPLDEDFGMSPVESMSAGKPVICSDHGGLLESVTADETGLFVNNQNLTENLINSINRLNPKKAASMRDACEARAAEFDSEIFIKKFKQFL